MTRVRCVSQHGESTRATVSALMGLELRGFAGGARRRGDLVSDLPPPPPVPAPQRLALRWLGGLGAATAGFAFIGAILGGPVEPADGASIAAPQPSEAPDTSVMPGLTSPGNEDGGLAVLVAAICDEATAAGHRSAAREVIGREVAASESGDVLRSAVIAECGSEVNALPAATVRPPPPPPPAPATTSPPTTVVNAPTGDLEVHFIDAGQADATLFLHADVAMLVDTGHWQRSDVVTYLRSVGVTHLDLVVVTHPHADHIGQFAAVLDAFDVTEVWWSGAVTTTATFGTALDALEASNAVYEEPRSGDVTAVGPLGIEVLHPASVSGSNLNNTSIAMRVTYGDVAFVLTGDAEAVAETQMVARHGLAADVLHLGHHGSSTSTTPAFLAAVSPSVAVYSAGSGNQYGHPHHEVIDRVAAVGADLYGTDVHGTVVVRTDGTSLDVTTTTRARPIAAATLPPPSSAPAQPVAPPPATATPPPTTSPAPPPSTPAPPPPSPPAPPPPAQPGCVNINTAGFDQLQAIIHIGPDRAQQILNLRPFGSVSAMDRISGIGPARLRDIINQGVACV